MEYEFVYFYNNKDAEINFIKKYRDDIAEIMIGCFAPGAEYQKVKESRIFHDIVQYTRSQWFFVMDKNKNEDKNKQHIIAFCKMKQNENVKETNIDVQTYKRNTISDHDNYQKFEFKSKTIGPSIEALCKRPGYKNAGAFLLKNMHDVLRKNKIEKVYLVPESMRSKEAYEGYLKDNNCKFKDDYYTENQKLMGFYKSVGYKILDRTYVIEKCDKKSDDSGWRDFIAYNVMYYDLNQKN